MSQLLDKLAADSAVNYSVPDKEVVYQEGAGFISSTFGKSTPFTNLSDREASPWVENTNFSPISAADVNSANSSNTPAVSTDHKVKLIASEYDVPSYDGSQLNIGYVTSPMDYRVVEFDNMPTVAKSMGVAYEALETVHMPASFQKYKHTDSITYSIDGIFTSRNSSEAARNYLFIQNLTAWTKPFFGEKQMNVGGTRGKLGAPPPVLKFSGWRGLLREVPVVITKFDYTHPNDCDWIPMGENNIPFPTVLKVSISLLETFNADEINAFDLGLYRIGGILGGGNVNNDGSGNPTPVNMTSGIPDNSSTTIDGTPTNDEGVKNAVGG